MEDTKRSRQSHIRLPQWMLRSRPFLMLSPPALRILLHLETCAYGFGNRVALSVRDAAAMIGSGTRQASRALAELVETGFVLIAAHGRFDPESGAGRATVYRLTRLLSRHHPSFRAFMRCDA